MIEEMIRQIEALKARSDEDVARGRQPNDVYDEWATGMDALEAEDPEAYGLALLSIRESRRA